MTPFSDAALHQVLDATVEAMRLERKLPADFDPIEREAAFAAIVALDPQDMAEAIFAGRMVIAHMAAMAYFRSAAQPNLPDARLLRLLDKASALSNLALRMQDALTKKQAAGARPGQRDDKPPDRFAGPDEAASAAAEPAPPVENKPRKVPTLVPEGPVPGTTIH